jgi:hypothetical protein
MTESSGNQGRRRCVTSLRRLPGRQFVRPARGNLRGDLARPVSVINLRAWTAMDKDLNALSRAARSRTAVHGYLMVTRERPQAYRCADANTGHRHSDTPLRTLAQGLPPHYDVAMDTALGQRTNSEEPSQFGTVLGVSHALLAEVASRAAREAAIEHVRAGRSILDRRGESDLDRRRHL